MCVYLCVCVYLSFYCCFFIHRSMHIVRNAVCSLCIDSHSTGEIHELKTPKFYSLGKPSMCTSQLQNVYFCLSIYVRDILARMLLLRKTSFPRDTCIVEEWGTPPSHIVYPQLYHSVIQETPKIDNTISEEDSWFIRKSRDRVNPYRLPLQTMVKITVLCGFLDMDMSRVPKNLQLVFLSFPPKSKIVNFVF